MCTMFMQKIPTKVVCEVVHNECQLSEQGFHLNMMININDGCMIDEMDPV